MIQRTTATRVLGPEDAGTRVSREEFATLDFQEPFKYERVKGRLVVMSPPGPGHRKVSRPFRRELGGYWSSHPDLIDDVDVEGWVATSEDDDRIPDICIYLAGEHSAEDVPDRIPDMVFEFVSESRRDQERDYIHKREEYHRIGVREYVIVDRFKQEVLVLTWSKDDYTEAKLTIKENYTSNLLPGLSIAVKLAFEES